MSADAPAVVGEPVASLVTDSLEADPRRHGQPAEQEAVLYEARDGVVRAPVVLHQPARAGGGGLAVLLAALLPLEVQAQSELGLAADAEQPVTEAQARLDAGQVVVAQAAFVAASRVQPLHARARGIGRVVRPLVRVARLAPPVAAEVRGVELRREHRFGAELERVAERSPEPPAVEAVVGEGVATRVRPVLVFSQAGVGELRALGVVAALEREGLPGAERERRLEVHVVERRVHVLARAVALLVHQVEQQPGASPGRAAAAVQVGVAAVAGGRAQRQGGSRRRRGRQVVHDAADRHRTEGHLPGPLQHLDAVEALDRRVVVGGVVAVRRVGQRQPVLEQQQLARARRVQPAQADVGSQAETLLVARDDAGRLAQRLGRAQHVRPLERLRSEHVARARDAPERLGSARDSRPEHGHLLREDAGAEPDAYFDRLRELEHELPALDGEARALDRQLVGTRERGLEVEAPRGVGLAGALETRGRSAQGDPRPSEAVSRSVADRAVDGWPGRGPRGAGRGQGRGDERPQAERGSAAGSRKDENAFHNERTIPEARSPRQGRMRPACLCRAAEVETRAEAA